ncbi:MAG: amidohydrolase [Dehalococcoidia bacterium]|nr:MAG: amidohydrolase [Dehalococcoidia bacterium]
MIIDFHTHVLPPNIREQRHKYAEADACFAALYADKRAQIASAEELITSMDKNGIDVSVVLNIGWTNPELCAETNDYIIEAITRYPGRLVGFGAVQPGSIEATAGEIERLARGGIRGIGEMRPDIQDFDLSDDKTMTPLVETMTHYKLSLLLHCSEPVGHIYPGKGAVTPDKLYPFIARYPELNIICAHWGGGLPFYGLMPEVKKAFGNVYFDSAASSFLYNPLIYRVVSEITGSDHILFGSDYPLLNPTRLINEIKTLKLPPETEKQILGGNANRLLGLTPL